MVADRLIAAAAPEPSAEFKRWLSRFGMVPAVDARPLVIPGWESVSMYTAAVHEAGFAAYAAFDSETGLPLVQDASMTRALAEQAAKAALRTVTRDAYHADQATRLREREEAKHGG